MSGGKLEPHDHDPQIRNFGFGLHVQHGDTGKCVSRRGPFLRWRIRRALRVTKRRHDRGTATERRVTQKVAAVVAEVERKP
jgi:hypothetical protein